jgi:acetate kinase
MREPIFVINRPASSSLYITASNRSVEAGAHGEVEGIGTSPRLKVADVHGRETNSRNGLLISAPASAVSVWVVPTDENLMVA